MQVSSETTALQHATFIWKSISFEGDENNIFFKTLHSGAEFQVLVDPGAPGTVLM